MPPPIDKMDPEKLLLTSGAHRVLTHAVLGLGARCSLQDFIDLVQREGQNGGAVTLLLCQRPTVMGH